MKPWEIRVIEKRKNLWIVTIDDVKYTATKTNGVFFNSVTGCELINISEAIKI